MVCSVSNRGPGRANLRPADPAPARRPRCLPRPDAHKRKEVGPQAVGVFLMYRHCPTNPAKATRPEGHPLFRSTPWLLRRDSALGVQIELVLAAPGGRQPSLTRAD